MYYVLGLNRWRNFSASLFFTIENDAFYLDLLNEKY